MIVLLGVSVLIALLLGVFVGFLAGVRFAAVLLGDSDLEEDRRADDELLRQLAEDEIRARHFKTEEGRR